ncbi:MAG: nucleotidyltransferase domain-containing protein [Candidatus Aenigmatarchaeota archaeon]|nr:MAG: nucleotidyltransferase domain-containing protein [Candidatus Aenigmarchaeota archaeon]
MMKEFEKYAGFKVLNFFLLNPKTKIHIKALAKRLKVSPSTAKFYCDLFLREELFNVEKKGNLKIFSLNNNSVYTRELKKVLALIRFKECGMDRIIKSGTLAVYGSYASGEFDERSDVDILVIGKKSDLEEESFLRFRKKLKKDIQITIIPYYRWERMKKRKDPFVMEVLENHILIKGEKL